MFPNLSKRSVFAEDNLGLSTMTSKRLAQPLDTNIEPDQLVRKQIYLKVLLRFCF